MTISSGSSFSVFTIAKDSSDTSGPGVVSGYYSVFVWNCRPAYVWGGGSTVARSLVNSGAPSIAGHSALSV
ncbi:hypothetical protein L210DRAFT_3574469 [Boletus edulis BED1]|uniref:Uncharacterized protein n=1 Tax=Boletus edulis BED1 TaxID=1328754 RepID=A0AAD4BDK0_BOLED|nr:hypothetical protein L210DRAFT_3574469 [Boletus edulis BED1]